MSESILSSLDVQNVFQKTQTGEVSDRRVLEWAASRHNSLHIAEARTAYRALAISQLSESQFPLSTAHAVQITMTQLEGIELLKHGHLEAALRAEIILQSYCDKDHIPRIALDRAHFVACGDACREAENFSVALKAYCIAGDKAGLHALAKDLRAKLDTALDKPGS